MPSNIPRNSSATVCATLALIFAGCPSASRAAPAPERSACAGGEFHELDFWIGDWDTFESEGGDGKSVARARVDPIAGGCALHELYEQTDGLIGDSILSFDPVRRQWQQTWVTNRGSIMVIVGAFHDGALVLEGEAHLREGRTVIQRITWTARGDAVRESAVLSRDGGKTWSPAFDVVFRKHGG